MLLTVAILLSWLFIGNQAAWYSVIASSALIAATLIAEKYGLLQAQLTIPSSSGVWVAFTASFIIIAVILQLARNTAKTALEKSQSEEKNLLSKNIFNEAQLQRLQKTIADQELEQNKSIAIIQRRQLQIQAISNVSQFANTYANLDITLNLVTQSISDLLGHYHLGIYVLSDDGVFAVLKSSNSEGGKRLIANGHKLRIGSEGMVGYVASQGKTRLALDIKQDEYFVGLQELYKTQSEITLPLKIGSRLIGVLDIESEHPNAFKSDDLEIYNTLANQIAFVIENSYMRERAKRATEEVENLTQEYMSSAWRTYKRKARTRSYFYSNKEFKTLSETKKLESLSGNSSETTSIPIQLRGVTIGHLDIQPALANRKWTDNEVAIIESTAGRLALALENARLVTESQRRATKEKLIGEISSRVGSNTSINSIMQTAITEIGKALPGAEIAVNINLKNEDESP
jgi:GAF domain-containing protein